jgi:hypothetical protein
MPCDLRITKEQFGMGGPLPRRTTDEKAYSISRHVRRRTGMPRGLRIITPPRDSTFAPLISRGRGDHLSASSSERRPVGRAEGSSLARILSRRLPMPRRTPRTSTPN